MTQHVALNHPSIIGAVAVATPVNGKVKDVARYVTQADVRAIKVAITRAFAERRAPDSSNPFLDQVLPRFERTRADYLALARRVALELSKKLRRPLTVDDVRKVCPPPAEYDGRIMGAIFSTSDWVFCQYVRSERTTCHKRPIATFDRA